jgi:hypothetical protein
VWTTEVLGVRSDEGRGAALVAVEVVHTAAWFSIEACMIYVLWAGLARRSDRRAAVAGAVVPGECVVFAANGFRCPLTEVARRLGAERVAVTDTCLPRWSARYLPAIHVPLVVASVWLHARNVRQRRSRADRASLESHRSAPRSPVLRGRYDAISSR